MVTSSEGMLYGVLSNTTNLRPAVTLDGILVVSTSGLEKRLISSASSSDNTDLGTDSGRNSLLSSRRKSKTGSSLLFVVGDNNGKGTRASGKSTTISLLGLNVADNGSLGDNLKRKNISDSQGGLLSAVNKLTSVHTLSADEKFVVSLITVSIQELDLGKGSSSTGVMDDLLDNSTDVSLLFGIVQSSELDSTLSGSGVRLENSGLTLTLGLQITQYRKTVRTKSDFQPQILIYMSDHQTNAANAASIHLLYSFFWSPSRHLLERIYPWLILVRNK